MAIGMTRSAIAEIRGVGAGQNLDSQISDGSIVSAKLKEFGSKGESYQKKAHDMKLLTQIDKKNKLGLELTMAEIRFLYELDTQIRGFGNETDPRIQEIKNTRDVRGDLVIAYDFKYKREEFSFTKLEGSVKLFV